MSLLLDALHRSDQERNNQHTVAGLHTLHRESAISRFNPRRLLAGVAVLLLALLLWVLMRDSVHGPGVDAASFIRAGESAAGVSAAGGPAAGMAHKSPAPEAPAPTASTVPESFSAQSGRAAAAVVVSAAVATTAIAATPDLPTAAQAGDPEAAPLLPAGVAELYQRAAMPGEPSARAGTIETASADASLASKAAPPAAVQPAASEPLPVEAILAAAQEELAAPAPVDDPRPLVQELPQGTRDALPSIFFSSHSWSNQLSEKQVTLNGKVVHEGDTVMPGVRLIEIMPEYIVLDFQGTRFRLRALNSWVNL